MGVALWATPPTPIYKECDPTMARFVSQSLNFTHGVRDGQEEYLGHNGKMVPEVRGLEAVFQHGLLNPSDIAAARSGLKFRGTVQDEAGREIEPLGRLSAFDTELAAIQNGWTPDEEELVVQTLRESPSNGSDFLEIIPTAAAKPWPGYDDVETPERIVEIALDIGADLKQVIAYEVANRNAAPVVNALEAAGKSASDAVVVTA